MEQDSIFIYKIVPKLQGKITLTTLQRQNAENLKQIFPEKENIGVSVSISTFMCLWANYIFSRWVCHFCWRKYVDRSWEYINRSQTHECGNWSGGHAIPRKGIYNRNCRCGAPRSEQHKAWLLLEPFFMEYPEVKKNRTTVCDSNRNTSDFISQCCYCAMCMWAGHRSKEGRPCRSIRSTVLYFM